MGELYPDRIDRALMLEEKHDREGYRSMKLYGQNDNLRPEQKAALRRLYDRLIPEINNAGILKS